MQRSELLAQNTAGPAFYLVDDFGHAQGWVRFDEQMHAVEHIVIQRTCHILSRRRINSNCGERCSTPLSPRCLKAGFPVDHDERGRASGRTNPMIRRITTAVLCALLATSVARAGRFGEGPDQPQILDSFSDSPGARRQISCKHRVNMQCAGPYRNGGDSV